MSENSQVYMYKGDDKTLRVTVADQDSIAIDLLDCSLRFSLKALATDETPLIEKTTVDSAEIAIIPPTSQGIAEVYLIPADTVDLAPGTYAFDVELTTKLLKIYTLLVGTLTLQQDVSLPVPPAP